MFRVKDKSCWKELDDDIIYYQREWSVNHQYLIFRNIQTDQTMQYFNIVPKSLGLLNIQNQYLNLFIETSKYTIIARLYKANLNLKIFFRLGKEYLFYNCQIHDLKNNLLLILYNKQWSQLSKNKLLRKQNGWNKQILQESVITRMVIKSIYSFRQEKEIYNKFLVMFEQIFNISIKQIEEKYGQHSLKIKGDFIILKKPYKFKKQIENRLPAYYLHLDQFLKGQGQYGKVILNVQESLKLIKQVDNHIYAVIKEKNEYNIYEIKSELKKDLIFSIKGCSELRKPILQQKYLILTNSSCPSVPIVSMVLKYLR